MRSAEPAGRRVLVVAPIGRDAPTLAELIRRTGFNAQICRDVGQLAGEIDADTLLVVLAEEALVGTDIDVLSQWVARQPPWSELPFLILTTHSPAVRVTSWRERLVTALRNVSLLERPVQAITLTTAVQAVTRSRMRQYELGALLESQKNAAAELEHLVLARTQELQAANHELHRQIAERTRIEESLRQAQKMEAIGQLTGGIAHDFNNLLMVILGGLTMFERSDKPERRTILMQGIRQAAERGATLTRQLLAFSRRQSLQPQSIDLSAQIGGMRELLDRSLGEATRVQLQFADDLGPVHVDPGELELVVLNLIVNARDAMPGGGVISIEARNVPGGYVRLAVVDSGMGMTQAVKEHAFEPFFTTKAVGKGSGLGLAQVYGFVQQSGGTVQIESEVGQGTTIILMLPCSSERPAAYRSSNADATRPLETTVGGSVLLVEDNDEVAVMVGEMLADLGYEVQRKADAAAALGALESGIKVDLVFSDIVMPGTMDGVELALQIRLRRRDLPVLLTSGYAHDAVQRAEEEGFRVLPKPYDLRALAAALETIREEAIPCP